MSLIAALIIGVAGSLGAALRFGADTALTALWHSRHGGDGSGRWPWATLLVNAAGSFGIGLCTGLLLRTALDPFWFQVLATGLAGGLTTFSSLTVATVLLWRQRHRLRAATNLVANTVVGLLAAVAGLTLGS